LKEYIADSLYDTIIMFVQITYSNCSLLTDNKHMLTPYTKIHI